MKYISGKFWWVFVLSLLFAVTANASGIGGSSGVGGMPSSPVFSGTVSSTKACAAQFVRVGPNFCMTVGDPTIASTSWTDATACTARTFDGTAKAPADAKAALVAIQWVALAGNAIALRTNQVVFFHNAACTGSQEGARDTYQIREFAAVAAGTTLASERSMLVVPLPATNTVYATQANAGGNGNSDISSMTLMGYFD